MQKYRISQTQNNMCNTHSEELAGIRQWTACSESPSTFPYYSQPAKKICTLGILALSIVLVRDLVLV